MAVIIGIAVIVGLAALGNASQDVKAQAAAAKVTTTTATPTTTTQAPTTTTRPAPTTTTKPTPTTRAPAISQREIDTTSFIMTVRDFTSAGPLVVALTDDDLIRLGDSVCRAFDSGATYLRVVTTLATTANSPRQMVAYGEIVGAATGTLCERHMNKIPGTGR